MGTKFKTGGRYLIQDSQFYPCHIVEIEIINMSQMCYKVKYVLSGSEEWILIRDFDEKYLVEEIEITY